MRGHSGAVDRHIGAQLRAARRETGKSRTEVAQSLGIAFQQIQKYEKGINRISASTLYELSLFLDKPVQFFFDGLARRRQIRKPVKG
jgi:transcriptional regulator with XRE-family HTH domain